MTSSRKAGQYQVVTGNDVEDAYDAVMALGGLAGGGEVPADDGEAGKQSLFNSFIAMVSGIFTPLLGLMCGCGILKGLSVFLGALGLISTTSGTYVIINAIGDVIFYFFPVFVAYTAAEKFGMNRFTAMAIGAALLHPNISALSSAETLFTAFEGTIFSTNVTTTFLGIPVLLMSYSSTVVPAILAVWVGSKVEKFFKKVTPTVIKMFFVPAMTLLVTVPLTLLAVGLWLPGSAISSAMCLWQPMTSARSSPVRWSAVCGRCWSCSVCIRALSPSRSTTS